MSHVLVKLTKYQAERAAFFCRLAARIASDADDDKAEDEALGLALMFENGVAHSADRA